MAIKKANYTARYGKVVMRHFGMETTSFNYLALYDADYQKIMANLKAIAEASKQMILFLEALMPL